MWRTMAAKFALATFLLLSSGLITGRCAAQQQYFRVSPKPVRVLEGGEAVLECEVANLGGQVQWVKDGFALGFSSTIQGLPRYTVVGDKRHGVYNLRISNATLDDDAEYQCQVGPARGHKVIRANAELSVVSPPTSVDILGYAPNSKIEIQENQELTLECQARNSKPAARLVWYRGREELKIDRRVDEVVEIEAPNKNAKAKRYTVKSRIQLKPNSGDDYAEFTCEARHEALPRDLPMRTTVQLSVLYPPGVPYIEGYTNGETVRRGQTVELVCRSRGGNPPAQLVWYKNSDQIQMTYRTAGRLSENVYTFTADASDNKARYKCEARNTMISTPLKAEVDLTVMFAPEQVSISGATEAKVGETVPLTCTTAPSNPPAEIKWMVTGKQYRNATNKTVVSPEGGWVTTSNITVVIEANRRSIVVVCHGLNMQLTENVVSTHTINVLYPPSAPMITGYQPGSILAAGTVQRMMCISSGGNPLATLTWYKNDKKIHSIKKTTDKQVTSEVTVLTNVTDNNAQYRCEAQNSATNIPLFESVTLSVHFAPEAVRVSVEPKELKPGVMAKLTCDGASSNPPAVLSWWRDGIPVQSFANFSKPGLHGGTVSSIYLKLNITRDMNGLVYTCQAMNDALQRSVHDVHTLRVLYPPAFEPIQPEVTIGVENEPLIITVKADGNPGSISYTWTKDGLPISQASHKQSSDRILSDGATLNITRLSRLDAGIYTCEAINSQGSSTTHINVDVQFSASVLTISENVVVNTNEDATLTCTATGNPLMEEHITWKRDNYKELDSKTWTTYEKNGTSFLHIKNAVREDVGAFQCVADNKVGNKSYKDVWLLVKFKPEMDLSPSLLKAASNMGESAELICRCLAVPEPSWTWSRSGASLPVNSTGRYYSYTKKLGPLEYETRLRIERVSSGDYGSYECGVRNSVGFNSSKVLLNVTTAPDEVQSLQVMNVTHDSVTLSWIPGFNGGLQASYRIRYRNIYDDAYKYEDVVPRNSTKWTVRGLQLATDYLFSIMALNRLGQSKYRPDDVKATTSKVPPSFHSPSSDNELGSYSFGTYPGMLIITGTIIGTALILLNVLIIGFCLHRRANKRIRGALASPQIGEMNEIPDVLLEKGDLPRIVIISVSIVGAIILLINIALVICFMYKKRVKRLREQAGQSSKSATIEMYAPSSYNDTMTGETLSSVSEKSETYSNEDEGESNHGGDNRGDMNDNRIHADPRDIPGMMHGGIMGQAASTYLTDGDGLALAPPPLEYAPPRYQDSHSTLPHPRHVPHVQPHQHHTLNRNSLKSAYVNAPSPMPPLDGSYYNMCSDRYLSYPPVLQQNMIGRTPTPPQQYGQPINMPPNMAINMSTAKMVGSNANLMMHPGQGMGGSPIHNPTGASPPPNYIMNHHDRQVPTPNYIDRPSGGTLRRQRGDNKMVVHPQNGNNPNTVPPDVTVLHGNCNQQHPRSPPPCINQPQSILKDPSRHLHKQHSSPMSNSPVNTSQILTVQNLAANDSLHQSTVPAYGTIKRENKTANKLASNTIGNDSGIIMNNSGMSNMRGEVDTNAV